MKYNFHGTFEKHPRLYFHDDGGEEGTLDITIPYTELMQQILWFVESDLFLNLCRSLKTPLPIELKIMND